MARFQVTNTFQLKEMNLFVIAGSTLEGRILKGMFAHVPVNSTALMTAPIYSIEFARKTGGAEDVCLCFPLDSKEAEIWSRMNLSDEILEITDDASAC